MNVSIIFLMFSNQNKHISRRTKFVLCGKQKSGKYTFNFCCKRQHVISSFSVDCCLNATSGNQINKVGELFNSESCELCYTLTKAFIIDYVTPVYQLKGKEVTYIKALITYYVPVEGTKIAKWTRVQHRKRRMTLLLRFTCVLFKQSMLRNDVADQLSLGSQDLVQYSRFLKICYSFRVSYRQIMMGHLQY